MKLLYVAGYNRMILFNRLIPQALRSLGFQVLEFDWNSVLSWNKTIRLFTDSFIRKKRAETLLRIAKTYKPDLIFVLKGEAFEPDLLGELKKNSGSVMFNWFGDDPWEFPTFSSRVSKYYDHFFTYDPYSVSLYKKNGHPSAYHLHYGYDVEYTDNITVTESDKKKYACEVSIIGSYYPEREKLISKLAKKYDVKIWGRGWKNTSLKKYYQGSALYADEMLKAMKCGGIVLNIHKGYEQGIHASGSGLNLRVMEAAACGAVQISNLQEDIPHRFIPDKEILLFSNEHELFEKLDYCIAKKEFVSELGKAAHSRVHKEHTLKIRFAEMFEMMKIKTPA